eukprot:scaffold23366_cov112-Isochrysis_galbana.AAC.13
MECDGRRVERAPVPGISRTPLVLPHVERTTEDFKIRVTVANLSEKSITLPHMQALASIHVRFKIHDGYDSEDEDPRRPSEKLTAEKLEMLDSAVIDPNDELTLEQKDQVRQLLARRIDAFALNPKNPSHTHLVEVELPLNRSILEWYHIGTPLLG